MSSPWFKFYPAAWRSEPTLRMCCGAARALWIEMLCVMHEASPRGYFLVHEKQPTAKNLALIHGISVEECQILLAELEENGVFSRDEKGIIFSRKMVRDEEKAEQDKANGRLGGNPQVKHGVNPPVKHRYKNIEDREKIEERKIEERKEVKEPRAKRGPLILCPADFEPSEKAKRSAEERGFDQRWLKNLTRQMHLWSHDRNERRANWDLTLQRWILRAEPLKHPPKTMATIAREIYRESFGNGISSDFAIGNGTGSAAGGLLPSPSGDGRGGSADTNTGDSPNVIPIHRPSNLEGDGPIEGFAFDGKISALSG